MVEELVPLDSSLRVWGEQGPQELLARLGGRRVVRDMEVIPTSRPDLVLEVSDIHGVPRRVTENHLIEAHAHRPKIRFVIVLNIRASVQQLGSHGDRRP